MIDALGKQGFPVAKAYAFCRDDSIIGAAFYIMSMEEGRVFWDPTLPSQTQESRRKIFTSKIETLAMRNLGLLYDYGQGVAQDYPKAREWYEKAVATGDARSNERLQRLHIREAAGTGRYGEALQLAEEFAAKIETQEIERTAKPGQETAEELGEVAWFAVLAREYARALAAAERVHALLPANLAIEANHAHALMFLGRGSDAGAIYFAHKGERLSEGDPRVWEGVIADDFATLRKAGVRDPMMEDIENQLYVAP